MKWLFWKEYRQNRVIVFAMLFIMFVPYIVALIGGWILEERLQNCVVFAAYYSLMLSQLIMALIGGNAFAGERADRSAEFQVYLPIPRIKILAAKLLLALSLMAFIWLTSAAVLLNVIPFKELYGVGNTAQLHRAIVTLLVGWVIGLVFFSVAWLSSSVINSPVLAALVGLLTPPVIWSVFFYIGYRYDTRHGLRLYESMPIWNLLSSIYIGLCIFLAVLGLGIGSWLYLRRVEP